MEAWWLWWILQSLAGVPTSVGQDQELGTPLCAHQPPQTVLLWVQERGQGQWLWQSNCRTRWGAGATAPSGRLFPGVHCHPPFPGAAPIAWLDLSHPRMPVLAGQRHLMVDLPPIVAIVAPIRFTATSEVWGSKIWLLCLKGDLSLQCLWCPPGWHKLSLPCFLCEQKKLWGLKRPWGWAKFVIFYALFAKLPYFSMDAQHSLIANSELSPPKNSGW